MEPGVVTRHRPGPRNRRPDPQRTVAGLGRVRRIALLAALVALIPVVLSYWSSMSQPSNSSLGIRTVEWLRDNGAAGLVARVESTYYTLTAPGKGGPTLRALPKVGYGAGAGRVAVNAEYRPPRVPSMIHPALPGEGVWHATRPSLAANPPVLLTTLRDQLGRASCRARG